jgi:ABC-type Fe3+/spermidine/putrescine transport system ATPase subunit
MQLELKGLTYSLSHKRILENLDFQLEKAQMTAILGANGAGKSTLLQLMAGLLDPEEGQILFKGEKVWGPSFRLVPGHPKIALVRQDSRLLPMHSVRDNLVYVLRAYDTSFQTQKIKELASLLGIEPNLDRVVKYLSGGEQQRVAIAVALASGPELLLLDEPFSQTDRYIKQELKHYLGEVVRQLEVGIVFVTHDPEEALALSDEIVILHEGRLIERGKGRDLYYQPKQEVTAVLTGLCNWLPKSLFKEVDTLHSIGENWLLRPDQVTFHTRSGNACYPSKVEKVEFAGFYELYHLWLIEQEVTIFATKTTAIENPTLGEKLWISF